MTKKADKPVKTAIVVELVKDETPVVEVIDLNWLVWQGKHRTEAKGDTVGSFVGGRQGEQVAKLCEELEIDFPLVIEVTEAIAARAAHCFNRGDIDRINGEPHKNDNWVERFANGMAWAVALKEHGVTAKAAFKATKAGWDETKTYEEKCYAFADALDFEEAAEDHKPERKAKAKKGSSLGKKKKAKAQSKKAVETSGDEAAEFAEFLAWKEFKAFKASQN